MMHISWSLLPEGQNVLMGNHEQMFGSAGKRLFVIELLTQNIWTVQLIFLGFLLLWERSILGLIKGASQVTIGSPPTVHGAPRQTSLIGNTWGLRLLLDTKFEATTDNIPVLLLSKAVWSSVVLPSLQSFVCLSCEIYHIGTLHIPIYFT